MRMALALSLLALNGACVAPAPAPAPRDGPLRVSNDGQPFRMWEGALARQAADAACGPRGVRVSIYDRFDRATGEWVYPGGCA
jgi:hypothetical protein